MAYDEAQGFCDYCRRWVAVRRPAPNHVLHLLLTIFLCGLWVIPWILTSIRVGGWHCSACGGGAVSQVRAGTPVIVWVLVAALIGIGCLGLFVFAAVAISNAAR